MDNEMKMMLLKHVDSYWDMLPSEIKEMILKYKESQELIEWRESFCSRNMCRQIKTYGQSRQEWFIGPVQCKPLRPIGCRCRPRCSYMLIYGHYWDLNGNRKQVFLDFLFRWRHGTMCLYKKRIALSNKCNSYNEHISLHVIIFYDRNGSQNQIAIVEVDGQLLAYLTRRDQGVNFKV